MEEKLSIMPGGNVGTELLETTSDGIIVFKLHIASDDTDDRTAILFDEDEWEAFKAHVDSFIRRTRWRMNPRDFGWGES